MIAALSQPPQNLAEEAGDYWYQLVHGYENFELDQELINAINTLTLVQWQQFYQSYFIDGGERSLLLVSEGQVKSEYDLLAKKYKLIDSVSELKQTAESLGFK